MKKIQGKHLVMGAVLVVAAWLALFGDKTPDDQSATAVVAASAPKLNHAPAAAHESAGQRQGSGKHKPERDVPILALVARNDLISVGHADLAGHQSTEVSTLFSTHSWVPPVAVDTKPVEPPAPVAPPLKFKYLGKKQEDGVWEVYLAQNDNVYIAQVQGVIDNKYRIDAITPNAVMLTYLPLNQAQRLNIRGND